MDIDELPEAMQEGILELKHGSAAIEADVRQELREAADLNEFRESVNSN